MAEPIPVILNAHAGGKYQTEWGDMLAQRFKAAGLNVAVTLAADADTMIRTAREALAAGAPLIVAGGGDGTLNAVAAELVDSNCVLGVLPLGTLNHFARDLGVPIALDDAIAVITAGHARTIDVGEVNDRIFLNNSSLGLYPEIVRDREHQQHRLGRGKWLAFATATLAALRRYPFVNARLEIDGVHHMRKTPFIFIGNNAYSMSGFTLGQRTRLDSGLLSLYTAQRTSRLGLLRLALRSLFGRLRQARDFDAVPAREILIETRHQHLLVATDGEVCRLDTPLRYRIRPLALRVMAPAASAAPV